MSFYHSVKPHMSPSAMSQWHNGRGQFVKSYFAQEKGPETSAMKGGTTIHALIEAGFMKAKCVYKHAETELKLKVPGSEFYFLGKPDSYELVRLPLGNHAIFVDYKSGKANDWADKLPTDLKMRATAWLVWQQTRCPEQVIGQIEFIQTVWDDEQKKVVALEGKESEIVTIIYTENELKEFTKVIIKTMNEVNAAYEKWKLSSGEFVNQNDVEEYVRIKKEIEEKEAELDEVGERIFAQMEFGGQENHKTALGTFFVKETKTYEYPTGLKINYLDMGLMVEDAEKIGAAAKAAIKNFELTHEPKEVKRKINFRAAKSK